MKDKYKTCCFCGKRLNSASGLNNADPLIAPDEEGDFGGCCKTCNNEIVKPAREVLWNLDKHEYEAIVPFVQQMSLKELQQALNQDDVLSAFYAFKKKHQKSWITRLRRFCDKHGIQFESVCYAAGGWSICVAIAIVFYVVFVVLLKWV